MNALLRFHCRSDSYFFLKDKDFTKTILHQNHPSVYLISSMGGGCSILNLARKQTSKYDKDNTVSHEFKKVFFNSERTNLPR
jgi:hypothetical protein